MDKNVKKQFTIYHLVAYLTIAYLVITIPTRVAMSNLLEVDDKVLKFQLSAITRVLLTSTFFMITSYFSQILYLPKKVNLLYSSLFILASIAMLALSTGSWLNDTAISWSSVVIVCLSIGVFEEYTFRGVVFPALIGDSNQVVKAAVISSLLFGLMHLENLWGHEIGKDILTNVFSQVLFAASMGILLCGIYAKTGSLLSVMTLHTVWDVINISKSKLKMNAPNPDTVTGDPIASAIFGLLILSVIGGIGYLLLRSAVKTQSFAASSAS